MRIFEYALYRKNVILTALIPGAAQICEFRFPFAEKGTLILGKTAVKIENGCCQVKISGIEDGILTPHLITETDCYSLEKIRVFCGIISPLFDEIAFVNLNKSLLDYRMRLDSMEEETERLKTAVYGKKIF